MNSLRLLLVCLIAFWSATILWIFVAAMPYSPVSLDLLTKINVMSVLPEGWGFFSRNPREVDLLIFEKHGGAWAPNRNAPTAHYRNYFGIRRTARIRSIESARIVAYFESATWHDCDSGIGGCLPNTSDSILEYRIARRYAAFHDTIALVRQEPLPWAWAKDGLGKIEMPLSYLIIKIE